MPSAWNNTDEPQSEEVRSAVGRSPERTENPSTPLEDRSKQELYNRAEQLDLSGRRLMNKRELIEALRGRP